MCVVTSYELICPQCGYQFNWSHGDCIYSREELCPYCPSCGFHDGHCSFPEIHEPLVINKEIEHTYSTHLRLRKKSGKSSMYGFDRDGVEAIVEDDGQYKIVIRGKEFLLTNIKQKNAWNLNYLKSKLTEEAFLKVQTTLLRDVYTNSELNMIIRSKWLNYVKVDPHTIAAIPNEFVISDEIKKRLINLDSAMKFCKEILEVIDCAIAAKFLTLCNDKDFLDWIWYLAELSKK
jgi:hypothetical protein